MPRITAARRMEKKAMIREAALGLFSTKGYAQTRMRDIMNVTGMSKGGIYVYYESKAEILHDLIDQQDLIGEEWMRECLGVEDPAEALSCLVMRGFEAFSEERWCTLFRINMALAMAGDIHDGYPAEWIRRIEVLILRGQDEGCFRKTLRAGDAAWMVVSLVLGSGIVSAITNQDLSKERIRAGLELFLEYLDEEGKKS